MNNAVAGTEEIRNWVINFINYNKTYRQSILSVSKS